MKRILEVYYVVNVIFWKFCGGRGCILIWFKKVFGEIRGKEEDILVLVVEELRRKDKEKNKCICKFLLTIICFVLS